MSTAEDKRYQMDRALDSLSQELDLLLGLGDDLIVRVRSSQETAAKLKRISEEFKHIQLRED